MRFMILVKATPDSEAEVRQFFELEDFGDIEAVGRFRQLLPANQ